MEGTAQSILSEVNNLCMKYLKFYIKIMRFRYRNLNYNTVIIRSVLASD